MFTEKKATFFLSVSQQKYLMENTAYDTVVENTLENIYSIKLNICSY